MSLAIDPNKVTRVLIAGDRWYGVQDFCIDAYEYVEPPETKREHMMFGGGQDPLVPAAGFAFRTANGTTIAGPLTSILAVEEART